MITIKLLGCGKYVASALMKEGVSEWLDSIDVLYSQQAIDKETFCEHRSSKYVSFERIDGMTPIIDTNKYIIVTASLDVTNQRVGRINQFYMLWHDGQITNKLHHIFGEYDRDGQEKVIAEKIAEIVEKIK